MASDSGYKLERGSEIRKFFEKSHIRHLSSFFLKILIALKLIIFLKTVIVYVWAADLGLFIDMNKQCMLPTNSLQSPLLYILDEIENVINKHLRREMFFYNNSERRKSICQTEIMFQHDKDLSVLLDGCGCKGANDEMQIYM